MVKFGLILAIFVIVTICHGRVTNKDGDIIESNNQEGDTTETYDDLDRNKKQLKAVNNKIKKLNKKMGK